MLETLFGEFSNEIAGQVFSMVFQLAPLWIPVILLIVFWRLWVDYVRAKFFNSKKYILLEIKLPKESRKPPLAMELFFASTLHITGGESTWYDRLILGKTRPWFSLEMISMEGQVRFLIWTRSEWRNLIESGLYAQFPEVELHEVPDYTKSVRFDPNEMKLWACDFELTKADPYPIKTYVDYGMDKNPKEEEKVDPITPLIEFLGSIGKNQQVWLQIIIRAHKKEQRKKGTLFGKTDAWKDEAQAEIDKIIEDSKVKVSDDPKIPPVLQLTKRENEMIEALQRSVTKQAFDVGMRGLYIAKKDVFNPANITGLTGSLKQFSSEHLNGFKPTRWLTEFNYPWQDYNEIRQNNKRARALDAYKRRSYFFPPYTSKPFVLNTEELATIFHLPGSVSKTPTFVRIPSKKSEAPANLPI
jgi:hypothetical protein